MNEKEIKMDKETLELMERDLHTNWKQKYEQERQAKKELVKYLEICKEVIKRYVAFNSALMDAQDRENTDRLDNELLVLLNKHKEEE